MASPNPGSTTTAAAAAASVPNNNPAYNILARAHSPDKATTLFTDKIKNKPLLLQPSHVTTNNNTTTTTTNTDNRALRRHIRLRKKQYHRQHQRPRPLSAKEKRQLHVFDLRPSEIKYDLYLRLHRLWRGYVMEILGLHGPSGTDTSVRLRDGVTVTPSSHGSLLASMDFHGMKVRVVRCVDVGRVGLEGIVVRETRSTLVLVTVRDRVVTVLKRGTVFGVVVSLDDDGDDDGDDANKGGGGDDANKVGGGGGGGDDDDNTNRTINTNPTKRNDSTNSSAREIVFELHGSQLEVRPVERAVKKFKWKNMDYL